MRAIQAAKSPPQAGIDAIFGRVPMGKATAMDSTVKASTIDMQEMLRACGPDGPISPFCEDDDAGR